MGLGKTYSTKYLLDSNNNRGAVGQVLSTTSTGIDWVNANTVPGAGLWLANGDDIYNSNSGNVGIGTTSPDAKLEIEGDVDDSFYSVFVKNINAGSSAFVSKKWYNDETGANFGEIWRNSSTRTSAGQGIRSFNMYNSHDINFWSGGTHTMALVGSDVGIGTDNPSQKLDVQGTILVNNEIQFVDGNMRIFRSTNDMKFRTSGSDRMTILGTGDVCIGTTAPSSNGNYGTGDLNVENDVFASAQIFTHNNTAGNFSFLGLGKSSGTGASPTIVQANERIGVVGFYGYDGAAYRRFATIDARIDGTPAAGDMPGKLQFGTAASGTSSPTIRMVIDNAGNVGIGATTGTAKTLLVKSPSDDTDVIVVEHSGNTVPLVSLGQENNHGYLSIKNNGGVRQVYFNSASQDSYLLNSSFGIGTTSPVSKLDVAGTLGVSDLPGNGSSTSVLVQNQTTTSLTVINGDFATDTNWAKGTGWTISSGTTADVDGTQSATTYLYQSGILPNPPENIEYIITYTISNYSAGVFQINVGGYISSSPGQVANGTYEVKVTPTNASSNTIVYVQANADAVGSVTNILVKQVTAGTDEIQTRQLGPDAFGPGTGTGPYLPLAGGTMTGTSGVILPDNFKLKVGTGADIQIFHDTSANFIDSYNQDLNIRSLSADKKIIFIADNGDGSGVTPYLVLDGDNTHAYFTNPGNVGIGNTSPLDKLSVFGGNINIQNFNATTPHTADGKLRFLGKFNRYLGGINTVNTGSYVEYDNGLDFIVQRDVFAADGHFAMRINHLGNVGIGTTSPNTKLDVNGVVVFSPNTDGKNTFEFTTNASNDARLLMKSDTTVKVDIQANGDSYLNGGNVGINTTSPNSKLDVRRSGSGVALELIQTSGNVNDFIDLKMIAGNDAAGTLGTILRHKRDGSGGGDFIILTNPTLTGTPTEKLTVKSNGNVGIGTTTPLAKLDIQGTQGQLFSVTDDLSGEIFAVADISGVPIMSINSNGISTFAGDIKLGPSSSIILDDTPTASTASGSGTIVNWSVSATVTAGLMYILKFDGTWTATDADSEVKSTGMVAIALGANANLGMLLQGFFYKSAHGFTIGLPLYISNTAGALTTARPNGTNDYVRIVGYATSINHIYFDPDKTWVQVA